MVEPDVDLVDLSQLTTLIWVSIFVSIPVGIVWIYLRIIRPRRELGALKTRKEIANQLLQMIDSVEEQLRSDERQNVELRLKEGERHLMDVNGVSMIEPRRAPARYEGGHAGVSVRLAKGVYGRVGRSKSRRVPQHDIMKIIDTGTLHITNQRAVFTGPKQNREWRWEKLLNHFHDMKNGYSVIHVSSRQKGSGFAHVDNDRETEMICFSIDMGVAAYCDEISEIRKKLLLEMDNLETSIIILERKIHSDGTK